MRRVGWFVPILALAALGGSACAQGATPLTVVHPGDNGFALLMDAYDAQAGNDVLARVPGDPNATLTEKRRAVGSSAAWAAIALVQEALSKPVLEPPGGTTPGFTYMAKVRQLTRLLIVEEYVQLADGKSAAALDTMDDVLALSNHLMRWNLGGILTGVALKTIAIRSVARHLDQFSARDCDRLMNELKAALSLPDDARVGMEREVTQGGAFMSDLFKQVEAGPDNINVGGNGGDDAPIGYDDLTPAEMGYIASLRKTNPAAWTAFKAGVIQVVADQTRRFIAILDAYPAPPPEAAVGAGLNLSAAGDRLIWKYARPLTVLPGGQTQMVEKVILGRAQSRLLFVHAAVLRFRWEHNQLLETLDVLRLGDIALDPFTGNAFLYARPDTSHYTLMSAGPPARDGNGNAVPGGRRVPVRL